jgi:UDP-N-acetylglucosamine 2-epimerase
MAPNDFLRLLVNARCLVGNSSVGIRECSYLAVPAVNIGSRQEGRDRGSNVIDVTHDREAIVKATRAQLEGPRPHRDDMYGDGRAGERIADVLATAELTFEKKLQY